MKETQLVKQILDYCKYRNLLFWRNQSGAVFTNEGHLVKFGRVGSPDIIGCVNGQFIGVECKVGKNKQTVLQSDFARLIFTHGGQYWLVHSLDEFIDYLTKN